MKYQCGPLSSNLIYNTITIVDIAPAKIIIST